MTALRFFALAAAFWTGATLGHVGIKAALSIPELTARAAAEARW